MRSNSPKNLLFSEIERIENTLSNIKKKYIKNFDRLCFESLKTVKTKNKIIFYGNGGSASDAQHLAAELVVRYKKKKRNILLQRKRRM